MKQRKTKKKRNNSNISTILLVVVFFVGLSVLCYPSVSNWWNARVQSKAVAVYDEAIAALSETDYTQYRDAAVAYNEAIASIGSASAISNPGQLTGYEEALDVTGTGIMGYITIEKIGVELPIYHGTSTTVLAAGAGHLEGTSLPVGGESTHCVISAHRGLPSAMLFTDLDKLEVGDTFTLTVLDEILTYEVDQITIVLPTEIQDLYIEDGEDYCTLMTCTPYGVNTHRLMVRGHRVDNADEAHIRVTADGYKIDPILVAPVIAVPLLLALLVYLLVSTRKSKKK